MPTDLSLPYDLTLADVVMLLVVGLYVLEDLRRGFLFGLLDLTGIVVGLVAALLLYGQVANYLVAQVQVPYGFAKPISFGLIWLASDLLLALTLRRALAGPALAVARNRLGRLLGAVTGVARGTLVVMLILAVTAAFPLPEPVSQAIHDSRLAPALGQWRQGLERAMAGVVDDTVQDTLQLLTVRPESGERVDLPFRVENPTIDEAAEVRMLELVNAERTRAGLSPLTMDPTIREVARAYSVEMFRRGLFAHVDLEGRTPFDRMRSGGVRFSAAGENLALAPTVDVAHEGLMNSPGHRANILNGRFRRVGIGVASGGMHGKMFTQNFAD
jgi:uncharacterized protein YkwD